MENKEIKQEQEQETKKIDEHQAGNNTVLVDLHLKATRIITFLDMILDINNNEKLGKYIFVNGKFEKVQNSIIDTINELKTIYFDCMKDLIISKNEK